ncbi:uncharacterized protein LOC143898093 [Temnothorax americanus]|uniref:uncharacterized protein LOC143898093 n=1 Tax=Temnothorax americanus TaxID=1964332 RepID=UPI004067F123
MGKKSRKRSIEHDEEKENKWKKRFRRLERRIKNIHRNRNDVPESSPTTQQSVSETEEPLAPIQGTPPPEDPVQTVDQPLEANQVDDNVLKALGERVAVDKPLGAPIFEEIVLRWTDLFKAGLPKEEKSLLLKKYGTPENCLFINPPKINPEVKASLNEAFITRDTRLVDKQEKVTVCLAVLGTTLSDLLKGQSVDKLTLLERLSDIGRLLVDLQREETLTRRALILPNLNASVREALKATVVDEWLFGKQLEENLKTSHIKKLQRSVPSTDLQTTVHDDGRTKKTLQSAILGIPEVGTRSISETRSISPEETLLDPGTTSLMEAPYPGSRNIMRQALALKGIPEDALDIAVSSLSDSSVRQYETAYKKWWSYCQENHIDAFTISIPNILSFLSREFHTGASYGTINSYRSAIAFILGPEIGQDDRVKKFCRGVSKKRPPKPKYNSTWDPRIVIDFLEKWTPNNELDLEKLSLKLVTLLALITGHRFQTLALIDVRNIEKARNLIEIKIPARIKTSRPGREQPTLLIPFYPQNRDICVASTLEAYMERTRELRGRCTSLFISFKKPYKAVSTQTLSRWVKSTLTISGVDTKTFSAYSTRHASTSAAKRSGVSIDTIKKTAGWTIASETFAKVYNLRVREEKEVFARAILEQ